ncbi:hypothetical protein EVAR_55999_1 [Eumeta japonica]|uniref:Uncharacterized protein n=1 Tax=Eumeta variegata TaxID=151549 RepID=A0A4C1YY01_EUMVA|nr:hypothetical protein EVAR_55999_1 [Eumeta japonica]
MCGLSRESLKLKTLPYVRDNFMVVSCYVVLIYKVGRIAAIADAPPPRMSRPRPPRSAYVWGESTINSIVISTINVQERRTKIGIETVVGIESGRGLDPALEPELKSRE